MRVITHELTTFSDFGSSLWAGKAVDHPPRIKPTLHWVYSELWILGKDAELPLIFYTSNINVELVLAGIYSGSPVFPQSLVHGVPGLWAGLGIWQDQNWWQGHCRTGIQTSVCESVRQSASRRRMAHVLCAYTLIFPQQKAFTELLQKQFAQKNPWGALDWFDLYEFQFFNLLFTHKHLY